MHLHLIFILTLSFPGTASQECPGRSSVYCVLSVVSRHHKRMMCLWCLLITDNTDNLCAIELGLSHWSMLWLRDHSEHRLIQWETVLQCNFISLDEPIARIIPAQEYYHTLHWSWWICCSCLLQGRTLIASSLRPMVSIITDYCLIISKNITFTTIYFKVLIMYATDIPYVRIWQEMRNNHCVTRA